MSNRVENMTKYFFETSVGIFSVTQVIITEPWGEPGNAAGMELRW